MCDTNRINNIAKELISLDFLELQQLILEADSEELRDYYVNVHDFLLKKRQRQVLREHLY